MELKGQNMAVKRLKPIKERNATKDIKDIKRKKSGDLSRQELDNIVKFLAIKFNLIQE